MASRRLLELSLVWAKALVDTMATNASRRSSRTLRRLKKPKLTGANMSLDRLPAQAGVRAAIVVHLAKRPASAWTGSTCVGHEIARAERGRRTFPCRVVR